MPDSDIEKKKQQAAQVYAGMADEELRNLAEESWSLTEIGKEALKFELARRGLDIQLDTSPPDKVDADSLITIRQFRDLPAALLAKGALESAGVQRFLFCCLNVTIDLLCSQL